MTGKFFLITMILFFSFELGLGLDLELEFIFIPSKQQKYKSVATAIRMLSRGVSLSWRRRQVREKLSLETISALRNWLQINSQRSSNPNCRADDGNILTSQIISITLLILINILQTP